MKRDKRVKELESKNRILVDIVRDFHWMARRYADGRTSSISTLFNDHVRALRSMGVNLIPGGDQTIWARDSMGRKYDGLSEAEATPGTPEAKGEA